MHIKIINKSSHPLPQYETLSSAGMDIRANLEFESIEITSLERMMIPTGIFLEIPHGYEIQVRPRSGISWKKGLTLVNAPGTIDADYRGELKILLINLSKETQIIENGERIAQIILSKIEQIEWTESPTLSTSERGEGGFGSTGNI